MFAFDSIWGFVLSVAFVVGYGCWCCVLGLLVWWFDDIALLVCLIWFVCLVLVLRDGWWLVVGCHLLLVCVWVFFVCLVFGLLVMLVCWDGSIFVVYGWMNWWFCASLLIWLGVVCIWLFDYLSALFCSVIMRVVFFGLLCLLINNVDWILLLFGYWFCNLGGFSLFVVGLCACGFGFELFIALFGFLFVWVFSCVCFGLFVLWLHFIVVSGFWFEWLMLFVLRVDGYLVWFW